MKQFLILLILFNHCALISSPVSVSSGGFGTASYTARAILCAGATATSPLQSVGPGTSGQLLISNGTSALPSFQNNPASCIYLTTQTGINSLTIDNTILTSTYNKYLLFYSISTNTTSNISLQFSEDNGSSFITSNYLSGFINHAYNSATFSVTASASAVILGRILVSDFIYGYVILQGLNRSASTGPYAFGQVSSFASLNGYIYSINTGSYNVNSLRITFNDIAAGGNCSCDVFGVVD